jgi:hypothetical protein
MKEKKNQEKPEPEPKPELFGLVTCLIASELPVDTFRMQTKRDLELFQLEKYLYRQSVNRSRTAL